MKREESKKKKEEAYKMLSEGAKHREIRKATGLSESTIYEVAKKWRADHGAENIKREKTIKENVFERLAAGQEIERIIREAGIKPQTARVYASLFGKEQRAKHIARDNKSRSWCKTCRFRTTKGQKWHNCNYIEITGHSRGCPAERCDKYERGAAALRPRRSPKAGQSRATESRARQQEAR